MCSSSCSRSRSASDEQDTTDGCVFCSGLVVLYLSYREDSCIVMISDADRIISAALLHVQPGNAVKNALAHFPPVKGSITAVAIGKAAWTMAVAAAEELVVAADSEAGSFRTLAGNVFSGFVITKYGHSRGPIPGFTVFEAGHPVPDENSFRATGAVIDAISGLTKDDFVLFLVSGGGSALFEKPLIPAEEMTALTNALLASGADIVEMNTIRKRVSAVKGGRFAELCAPANVFSVVLSDIIGDPLDMIASGPACPDTSTFVDAEKIIKKYGIPVSETVREYLKKETPKSLNNVETYITGSVRELCESAKKSCADLGYESVVLTSQLSCEAKEAGAFLAAIAREHAGEGKLAYIAGGETVVHLTGAGKGGRNQELALSAARGLAGLDNVLLFSVGSDGTDGPTDSAGGYVTGKTAKYLSEHGIAIDEMLKRNDAYHALEKCGILRIGSGCGAYEHSEHEYECCNKTESLKSASACRENGGLIITGPTGTNVNDLTVLLMG